jgi:hypothetical protein
MTLKDATILRDEYVKKLIGRPYDGHRPDWAIKDIIISDSTNAGKVYAKMYEDKIDNETALGFFSIKDDEYDALLIAHPWPWEGGDILVESVQHYLKGISLE